MLWQSHHPAGSPEVFPMRFLCCYLNGSGIYNLRMLKSLQVDAENGGHIFRVHHHIIIKLDIFGRNGFSITPFGRRMNLKSEGLFIIGNMPGFCQYSYRFIPGCVKGYEWLKKQPAHFS